MCIIFFRKYLKWPLNINIQLIRGFLLFITTILFFWAALIKATRGIAGNRQGFSFGALEAGRGLVASICGSIAVIIYSSKTIVNTYLSLFDKSISSLSAVIYFYSITTFLSSLMILLLFETDKVQKIQRKQKK